ncbi:hypothetical protein LCGC14_0869910 [marine sediment metagenome]|uniref:Uncharacterized protein n=1 Tax=marine sediment metagenome TaxID=412755 RepID=A0A0F9P9V1_9ZZZZ
MVGRAVTLTSESQAGGALPSNWVGVGASDGSLFQALLVESATNPNLRISLYRAGVLVDFITNPTDAYSNNQATLLVSTYQYEFNGTSWDRIRHSFNQSTAGVNSNGAGTTLSLATTPLSKFTIIVLLTVGSAAFVVDLEGQVNGIGWVALGTLSSSSSIDALHVVNKPVNAIRFNVTTIGGGNTMTIGLLASAR